MYRFITTQALALAMLAAPMLAGNDTNYTYLALGDSIPFGFDPTLFSPTLPTPTPAQFTGYPEIVAKFERLLQSKKEVNTACPGETSGSFWIAGAPDNGCNGLGPEGEPPFKTSIGLHTNYTGTQLQFAVSQLTTNKHINVVTLSIGGNDLSLLEQQCSAPGVPSFSACVSGLLPGVLQSYAANLTAILASLRAEYTGTVVLVMSYSPRADPLFIQAIGALDFVMTQVGANFGVKFADEFTAFQIASAPFNGDPCAAGLLIRLTAATCDVHPSPGGAGPARRHGCLSYPRQVELFHNPNKREESMRNRREFIETMAGVAAGTLLTGRGRVEAQAGAPVTRREVRVGGKRVKVVDAHAHASIAEVADVVKGTPLERYGRGGRALGPDRIQELDKRGIDVQALDINTFWWYAADRDLATKIVQVQDEGLSKWCAAHPDRFVAFTSPALQFPDLAAQQAQHAVKELGMRGVAIGGHVAGEPLSMPKYDPFWAKVQELGVIVFMHPNNAENVAKMGAFDGAGDLGNIIGNPLETGLFLMHLIFDGTLDRFPGLKICGAHAGGYLPSYLGRTDVACDVRQNAKCVNKKHPREYLHDQILADSMVFSPEGIRHLLAEMGPTQVVYGTDIPLVWPDTIDAILKAEIPDAQKEAVLGGNLVKLLKL